MGDHRPSPGAAGLLQASPTSASEDSAPPPVGARLRRAISGDTTTTLSTQSSRAAQNTDGLVISRVGLGTMTFGEQNTAADAHDQLDRALDAGVNFIDTAEMYPVPARAQTQGESERIVGTWLARQPRDRVVVATKIAGPHRNMDWIRGGPRALDAANLRAALEASLRRLRTDYVDLYQIHWPARPVPLFG